MDFCIKCEINEIKHKNKKLCTDCYRKLRNLQSTNYKVKNEEKIKEKNRKYRENNKSKISQVNKDWYAIPENKEKKNLATKEYYNKHIKKGRKNDE